MALSKNRLSSAVGLETVLNKKLQIYTERKYLKKKKKKYFFVYDKYVKLENK